MVDTTRTEDQLLARFADDQPAGSIDPQAMRDFVVSADVLDTLVAVRQESDLPAAITAPDGVLRIPLAISTNYVFDLGEITITTPFWIPERLLGLERVRLSSEANTTLNYTGTDTLFWARNSGALEVDKVDFVATEIGTKCFDMVAGEGVVAMTLFNTAFLDLDMGLVSGFAVFGRRFNLVRPRGPFQIHNPTRCFVDNFRFTTSPSGVMIPYCILTGGTGVTNVSFANVLVETITAGQSYFAVDSGSDFNQTSFTNVLFDGASGSFFELDLTGDIQSFSDLTVLITGNPTAYVNDGNDNVLVTDSEHGAYVGLTVSHSGTFNYNNPYLVTRVLGADQYVMDAIHDGDEGSGGSYVGIGTRVTTTDAHNLTEYRTTDITDTALGYNDDGLDVLNVSDFTFDITTPFAGDEAGTYLTTSLDQTAIRMVSKNNGALADSMTLAEAMTNGVLVVPGAENVAAPVVNSTPVLGDWIEDPTTERFTVDPTSGVITYNGINDIALEIKYKVVAIPSSGQAQVIEFYLHLNTVEQTKTKVTVTTANDPNGTYVGGIFTLSTGNTIQLFKTNLTNSTNTDVEATILISAS